MKVINIPAQIKHQVRRENFLGSDKVKSHFPLLVLVDLIIVYVPLAVIPQGQGGEHLLPVENPKFPVDGGPIKFNFSHPDCIFGIQTESDIKTGENSESGFGLKIARLSETEINVIAVMINQISGRSIDYVNRPRLPGTFLRPNIPYEQKNPDSKRQLPFPIVFDNFPLNKNPC